MQVQRQSNLLASLSDSGGSCLSCNTCLNDPSANATKVFENGQSIFFDSPLAFSFLTSLMYIVQDLSPEALFLGDDLLQQQITG